jgi:hypothetical protein
MPSEADIVWSLKQHLQMQGLGRDRWSVSEIAVDSHGSYRQSRYSTDLEPMISMPIHGCYPDLVCAYQHPCEEGLAAFEVKGAFDDWMKGITQARTYREGVHRSYLALPEDKGSRFTVLERDARECGVGVWLLKDKTWEEVIPSAAPRPNISEHRNLSAALRGVVLPRRLQLNHPLNYLAVAWSRFRSPEGQVMEAMMENWEDLGTPGSRQHAINGARYLGLLTHGDSLSRLGLTVCDLMQALDFEKAAAINKRNRFCDASPGLAAVTRFVFMQQESTKLIVEALERSGNYGLNTEELLREAAKINEPLATGLFLTDPRDFEKQSIHSSAFTPSFTFQFKQTLWHSGILSTPSHKTAGKGANVYEHQHDYWKLEDRIRAAKALQHNSDQQPPKKHS